MPTDKRRQSNPDESHYQGNGHRRRNTDNTLHGTPQKTFLKNGCQNGPTDNQSDRKKPTMHSTPSIFNRLGGIKCVNFVIERLWFDPWSVKPKIYNENQWLSFLKLRSPPCCSGITFPSMRMVAGSIPGLVIRYT